MSKDVDLVDFGKCIDSIHEKLLELKAMFEEDAVMSKTKLVKVGKHWVDPHRVVAVEKLTTNDAPGADVRYELMDGTSYALRVYAYAGEIASIINEACGED